MSRLKTASLALIAALQITPVSAETSDEKLALSDDQIGYIANHMRSDYSVDQAVDQMLEEVTSRDIDLEPGLTQSDYDAAARFTRAQHVGQTMARQLMQDLDGDLSISKTDLMFSFAARQASQPTSVEGVRITLTRQQMEQVFAKKIAAAMKDDTNNDGLISITEIHAAALRDYDLKARKRTLGGRRVLLRPIPMSFDLNADGTIALDEMEAATRAAYEAIDTSHDGRLDENEIQNRRR
jgi:hypothetical protein